MVDPPSPSHTGPLGLDALTQVHSECWSPGSCKQINAQKKGSRDFFFSLEIYFAVVVKGTCCFLLSVPSIFSQIWHMYALPTPSPPTVPSPGSCVLAGAGPGPHRLRA